MIDIHSHIIPQVDDGPGSLETSLEMLEIAVEDGITEIVATPHILSNLEFQREQEILTRFAELQEAVASKGLPIKLHLGSEIYIEPEIDLNHQIATLGDNGRYFLIEFPMQGIPVFAAEHFFRVMMEERTPIIAHPERNAGIIGNPERAAEFVRRGSLLQVNAGSLTGRFGSTVKETAWKLLDAHLVHFVASDAHDTNSRPPKLQRAYDLVAERLGEEWSRMLFHDNQVRVLRGEPIQPPQPLPLEERKKKGSGLRQKIVSWWRGEKD